MDRYDYMQLEDEYRYHDPYGSCIYKALNAKKDELNQLKTSIELKNDVPDLKKLVETYINAYGNIKYALRILEIDITNLEIKYMKGFEKYLCNKKL